MTLIWQDGFDGYNTLISELEKSFFDVTGVAFNDVNERSGSLCLEVQVGGTLEFDYDFLFNRSVSAGGAFLFPQLPTGDNQYVLFRIQDSNLVDKFCVTVSSTGELQVRLGGPAAAVDVTATRRVFSGTYYYMEVGFIIDQRRGGYILRLEEEAVAAKNRIDTYTNTDDIRIIRHENTGGPASYFLDDVYYVEGNGVEWPHFLGSIRVYTFDPTSEGTLNEWQAYTNGGYGEQNGTFDGLTVHFNFIDENPPDDDLTYLEDGDHRVVERFNINADPPYLDGWGIVEAMTTQAYCKRVGSQNSAPNTGSEFRIKMHAYNVPIPLKGKGGLVATRVKFVYAYHQAHAITNWWDAQAFTHDIRGIEVGTELYRPLPQHSPAGGGV